MPPNSFNADCGSSSTQDRVYPTSFEVDRISLRAIAGIWLVIRSRFEFRASESLCASVGVEISAQGLDQRFSPQSAACLYQVLEACVSHLIRGDKTTLPVLRRFRAVYIQDSTTIFLPDALHHLFDGGSKAAGVKLQVRLDYLSGLLEGPFIYPAKAHGALRLADLGYFKLSDLSRIDDAGGFYLTRLHGQVKVLDGAGDPLDVLKFLKGQPHTQIQCNVLVGDQHRLSARLIAVPAASKVARHRRFKLKEQARKNKTQLSKTCTTRVDLAGGSTGFSQCQVANRITVQAVEISGTCR